MNKNSATLKLDEKDPRVIRALRAEKELFSFYGLEATIHFVPLPDFGGIRIRVMEIGSGRPVVIIPGNTGDVFPLAPLLAALPGRRIIAINRPGGGLSEGINHRKVNMQQLAVETINQVLDALEVESAPIVAHSMGGFWSLWMALEKPERVTALTLIGVALSSTQNDPPIALRLLATPLLNQIIFNLTAPQRPEKALQRLSFMGHTADTFAQLPASMADCYYFFQKLPHYRTASLSLLEQVRRSQGTAADMQPDVEKLKRITQPTMFLWGSNDTFNSVANSNKGAQLLPHAEFHTIAGGGHLAWLDNLTECSRLLQNFLADF